MSDVTPIQVRWQKSGAPCDGCASRVVPLSLMTLILTNAKHELGYKLPSLTLCVRCSADLAQGACEAPGVQCSCGHLIHDHAPARSDRFEDAAWCSWPGCPCKRFHAFAGHIHLPAGATIGDLERRLVNRDVPEAVLGQDFEPDPNARPI